MKHLLSAKDLSHDEAVMVLDTAEAMAATQRHAVKKLPTLRGKTVVNLFFEDSTRTRLSFEAAAKRLSADVINFSAKGSSVSKGESLKDTAQTIMAMGADAVVVRHSACGAAHLLAHAGWIDVPVLNAGDGTHQHPTQALLDAMTLRRWYTPGGPASGSARAGDGSPAPAAATLKAPASSSSATCCTRAWPAPTSTCSPPWAPTSPWWPHPPCCRWAWMTGPATCPTTSTPPSPPSSPTP